MSQDGAVKPQKNYRGRFAPTPSGPLHAGSLLTALASWLDARAAGGAWLLRIDDLDAARCPPGAAALIQRQLEAHGLLWDEKLRVQSQHVEEYREAYATLEKRGSVYSCWCTRARLAEESLNGPDGPIYGGRCRHVPVAAGGAASRRLHVAPHQLLIDDPIQGPLQREAAAEIGDFVLRRADGLIGYQLACVVDEAAQSITHVLRGSDLIGSSFRQRLLQDELALPQPRYAHLPVVVANDGRKLSKQNGAAALDSTRPKQNLLSSLRLLNQMLPTENLAVGELLDWAAQHWQPSLIARRISLTIDTAR